MRITEYTSAQATEQKDFRDIVQFFWDIKTGRWEDIVTPYRNMKTKEEQKAAKSKMPAFAMSGEFQGRGVASLVKHNGVICMDIDDQDNIDINEKIEKLKTDKHILALHMSLGGYGYAAYFKIDPNKHLESFEGLEDYLLENYQLECDPSCKDISRLRFISYDPNIVTNDPDRVPVFTRYRKKVAQTAPKVMHAIIEPDVEHMIKQLRARRIDLVNDYGDWLSIGQALASEYGERGRDFFHQISEINSDKYDAQKTDKKYDNILATNRGSVGIGTLFYLCKKYNIDIQTERTKKWEASATSMVRNGRMNKEDIRRSIKKLAESEGEDPKEALEIADKVINTPKEQLKKEKDDNIIPLMKVMLKEFDLKRNELTHEIEYKGKPITDTDMNSIYIQLTESLGPKCTQTYFNAIIHSDFIPNYNPFLEFFELHKDRKPKGAIKALIDTIKSRTNYVNDKGFTEVVTENYLIGIFIEKWIVSLIASMHGTYSLLILVLVGNQGIGKTNFFRWILPKELRNYYAESKLDRGKDDEVLMCKKLIICDDEFSGKSKNEYKLLKQYASTQYFSLRKPYERKDETYRRYAVLCGTSNESEVINDPTGNRRIIPINVLDIDFDAYNAIDKIDLLMEAYWLYQENGKEAWQMSSKDIKLLEKCTSTNKQVDTIEEAVNMFFKIPADDDNGSNVFFWSATEILVHIEANTKIKVFPNRLGIALKNLGFVQTYKRDEGKPKKGYRVELTGYTQLGSLNQ